MKKIISRTNLLLALVMLLIACLIGATTMTLTANAQEEEPTSTVTLTSYTSVLRVGERYTFAATVTGESNSVTWSSSTSAIVINATSGIAIAAAEGNATITATATDGAYASIDVLVSNTAIRVTDIRIYPEVLEVGIDWTTRLSYTILPQDAYEQGATWTSSNPSVITVDSNGNAKAMAKGTATITVTARDSANDAYAVCDVIVYDDLVEGTIAPDTLVMSVGQQTGNELTLTLPNGVTGSNYHWYSMEDAVASIDHYIDDLATIYAWNFGTTTIYGVAHGSDGEVYAAMATVHVTEEYFYIGGLESVNATNPWITYDTEAEAQAAGVLLIPSADDPYVYSITRSFWAFDDFQILNNTLKPDEEWPTRITSTSFVEDGSSMDYVANTADMFRVNALGTYTVTLDLSDGLAKVTIEMVTLEVTSFDLSVNAESKPYLQGEGDTMTLDVYTIPENATINPANVEVTLPETFETAVTATPRVVSGGEGENDKLYIDLTLNTAYTTSTTFVLNLRIKNAIDYATDSITITILADGESYVPVSGISFNGETYLVNVNNGAKPWVSSTPLNATVNADASVQDIVYTEESEDIYIEYINGEAYVHAAALGTYTIYATSLGADKDGNTFTAQTTVLVTSLIENKNEEGEVESYASGFYLIGILDGVEVEGWTSIVPEKQNFDGSDFADWQLPLPAIEEGKEVTNDDLEVYEKDFHFMAGDRMSIAFLGMNGDWDGIINEQYFNWNSYGNFYESNGNIEFTISGDYTVTLDLGGTAPSFTVELVTPDDVNTEYRIYYYIVRSGDSWDPLLNDEENVLARVGYINMLDGKAQGSFVYTTGSAAVIDFYEFYTENNGAWPNIQFVSAIARNYKSVDNYGIENGYFLEATWYGSSYEGIKFTGTAYYKAPAEPDPDVEERYNYFTNYENFSELYWVSSVPGEIPATMAGQMTVSFTLTLDATTGVLKGVALNFVTTATGVAE